MNPTPSPWPGLTRPPSGAPCAPKMTRAETWRRGVLSQPPRLHASACKESFAPADAGLLGGRLKGGHGELFAVESWTSKKIVPHLFTTRNCTPYLPDDPETGTVLRLHPRPRGGDGARAETPSTEQGRGRVPPQKNREQLYCRSGAKAGPDQGFRRPARQSQRPETRPFRARNERLPGGHPRPSAADARPLRAGPRHRGGAGKGAVR